MHAYDVVNRNTGETRTYSSQALANFIAQRLGSDWYVQQIY